MNPPPRAYEIEIKIGNDTWAEVLEQVGLLHWLLKDFGPEYGGDAVSGPAGHRSVKITHHKDIP
jgi:hypothetical protein